MIGAVCRRRLSTEVYTFLVYLAASASLLAAALLSGTPLTGHGAVNGLTALGMAVCCTLLGHNVFSWGLKYLPAAFIAIAKLLEPALASVWGGCCCSRSGPAGSPFWGPPPWWAASPCMSGFPAEPETARRKS